MKSECVTESDGMHEPGLEALARKVFADAYEYTMMYRDYVRMRDDEGQPRLF